MEGLNTTILKECLIPLPGLPEQNRIVAMLQKAEDLRRMRRYAAEMCDDFLQSVFLEMFGDPVGNPRNWNFGELGAHTSFVSSGSTPLGGGSVYKKSGIRFIRSQNVLMNAFDFSDVAFIDERTDQAMKRTRVKCGDVLLNITGASIGRVSAYKSTTPANVNQHVCIIRCRPETLDPIFLSFEISNASFQKRIISTQAGATRQGFNFDQIRDFKVIVAPLTLQRKFAAIVLRFERLRAQQREAERQAAHLFQTLLHRIFNKEL
jgi:type I restriction enzyme, S subunit